MTSVYKKILLNDPNLKNVLDNKVKFNTDLHEKEKILLSNEHKYSLVSPMTINFKVDYDLPVLLQNFLQDTFKIPTFNNMIMLENISTETDESFRIILSKIPFELIVSEYENYFDFIIEKNTEYYLEYDYKNISGFYINVDMKNINTTEILTLYQYITPFKINKNQEIEILKKNEFLKYNAFYILEKTSKPINFKMIFLQGKNINTENSFIEELIKKFNLTYTNEEILERIENNNILVNNQEREKSFDSYFSTFCCPDKNDIKKYICKINFNLYITLDFEKQKNYMKKIFNEILNILKKNISDTIFEFNNNNLPQNKGTIVNHDIFMETIKIKKNFNQLYNYYKINPKYNNIFNYICKKNNIEFGSDLLCIKKNTEFTNEKCFSEIEEFRNTINDIIDSSFKDVYKNFYDKKNELLKS